MSPTPTALAILTSGGLDSAILLGETLKTGTTVFPLYVRKGLFWEATELQYLRRFLEKVHTRHLQPLHILDLPVGDLYPAHWSLTGQGVPDAESSDDAVFLPGRNVLLLAKGILWCHLHGIPAIALAPLQSNPFPDATPEFFRAFQDVVNQAVDGKVEVIRPYAGLGKLAVMQRGRDLPLEWTFSCIRPVQGKHCGRCNKCAERRHAFRAAHLPDPTIYEQE